MRPWLLVLTAGILTAFASGCTHMQLERSTSKQVSTLTDLQYIQVLDNIAMFMKNPGALPFFAQTSSGTAQITDAGSTTDTAIMNAFPRNVWAGNFMAMASRNIQESWTLLPVIDPDKLKRMRCAYQMAVGCQVDDCDDCMKSLRNFFCADECKATKGEPNNPGNCAKCMQCAIPQGWFQTGCRSDVPNCACYVGHYCDTYVWVMPEGVTNLTRFTLSILDIATVVSHEDTVTVKRIYKGDWVEGNPPVSAEVTHAEGAQAPMAGSSPSAAPRLRMTSPIIVVPGGIQPVPRP